MPKYRIALLPGDGVGAEVVDAAVTVLKAVDFNAEYLQGDIGWEFWRREGNPLPPRTVELLRATDCALFGAITSKPVKEASQELSPALQGRGLIYRSPIVHLRQLLDLYICQRPCHAFAGNPLNYRDHIDITVFRENTEGMYIGVEFATVPEAMYHEPGMSRIPRDAAISIRSITPHACRRIVEAAFEYATYHDVTRVTAIHKANVMRATCGLFLEIARSVAERYPQIHFDEANVDAICMWLLKNPEKYQVLVTTNLFGDVISDLCAQLVGGLGFACSGNIGSSYAVFEPSHGSAPKYAGMNKVNPIATILSAKMMLEWLGEQDAAHRIEHAVSAVVAAGKVRTYDLGGTATTMEMAHAIAAAAARPSSSAAA